MVTFDNIELDYIIFNIVNSKNGSTLKNRYYYFNHNDMDKYFLIVVLNELINSSNMKNVDIHVIKNEVIINCFYTKMFNNGGGYSNKINAYLKIMNIIDEEYASYNNK